MFLCRIEVSESKDELFKQADDVNSEDEAGLTASTQPRRVSEVKTKKDVDPLPQANSFFVFSPKNK